MNIRSFALVVVSSCALSLAAEVGKSSDGEDRYVISVPAGETYKLTSTDISAAAGRILVKQGDGTLQGGGSVASFPGEIRIEAGTYHILSVSGFGTKAGATVVCDGATLLLPATSAKIEVPAQEQLVASGSGFEDAGAIRVTGSMGASLGRLALGADALLAFESDTTFSSAEIALEGHVLTLKGAAESVSATFSDVSAVSGGTIDVQAGRLKLEGRSTLLGTGDVYIRSGAKLAMKESSVETGWTLHLDDGAQIYPSDGYVTSELDNRWGGPVVSTGDATVAYTWNATKLNLATTFAAPLSGSGQISVLYGACLQLLAAGGDYSGLVSVQGKDGAGGLVLGRNGALPVSSQGIKIASGAGLILKGTDSFDLPQITAGSGDSYTSPTRRGSRPAFSAFRFRRSRSRGFSRPLRTLRRIPNGMISSRRSIRTRRTSRALPTDCWLSDAGQTSRQPTPTAAGACPRQRRSIARLHTRA